MTIRRIDFKMQDGRTFQAVCYFKEGFLEHLSVVAIFKKKMI